MDVLSRAAPLALALAGCYAPSVRDCTVTCASPGECASGQLCGSDGWCAAPEVAGRCAMILGDAGIGDARSLDARNADRSDGTPAVALRVQLGGKGSVLVDGLGLCSSTDPRHGDCTYSIAAGTEQVVHAIAIVDDQQFAMWTSSTCAGQGARCTFTPVAATAITARFAHVGIHDPPP